METKGIVAVMVVMLLPLAAGCATVNHESRMVIPAGTTVTVTDTEGVTTTTQYAADTVVESRFGYCRWGDQELQGLDIVFASGAGVELNKQKSEMADLIEGIATLMPLFQAIIVPAGGGGIIRTP